MAAQEVQLHNTIVFQNLEAGDLVEFRRRVISHWAVYVGNGNVIHFTGDENELSSVNISSCSLSMHGINAFVREDNIWMVANGCKFYRDNRMSPFTAEEIIRRARAYLGNTNYRYDIFGSNCEHFASYCRYGDPHSSQSARLGRILLAGGVLALGFALYRVVRQ